MDLPIDARHAPFKEKYLDEETRMLNRWFIFGTDVRDDTLQLSDGQSDVIVGLTQEQADAITTARDLFVQKMIDILNHSHNYSQKLETQS